MFPEVPDVENGTLEQNTGGTRRDKEEIGCLGNNQVLIQCEMTVKLALCIVLKSTMPIHDNFLMSEAVQEITEELTPKFSFKCKMLRKKETEHRGHKERNRCVLVALETMKC